MLKQIVLLTACLVLISGVAIAAEITIAEFPVGVAGSVADDFFAPYHDDLEAVAQTLRADPAALAILTGCADGQEYRRHHDAMNPGLALGRAHALRNFLVREFNVNPDQIIVQSIDVRAKGGEHRFVQLRLTQPTNDLATRVAALETRPPVEKHIIETVQPPVTSFEEHVGLRFGAGYSSSPYGGVPTASGAVVYKDFIAAEFLVGHTFWNNNFRVFDLDLTTKRRMIGGYVHITPDPQIPVGLVAGWIRIEEVSRQHYEYVRLSEGPLLGIRVMALPFLSLTGAYNPVNQRQADLQVSKSDDTHFLLSISTHIAFGGAK